MQAAQAQRTRANWIGIKPYGTTISSTALNHLPGVGAIGNSQLIDTCYGQWLGVALPETTPAELARPFDLTLTNGPNASANLVIEITGYTREDSPASLTARFIGGW